MQESWWLSFPFRTWLLGLRVNKVTHTGGMVFNSAIVGLAERRGTGESRPGGDFKEIASLLGGK